MVTVLGIRFSPAKCECITFCGKIVFVAHRFQAFMYGELLQHQPALKYLGVWFDEQLRGSPILVRRFARRGLAYGHCIEASAWVGGSILYCFFGWSGG